MTLVRSGGSDCVPTCLRPTFSENSLKKTAAWIEEDLGRLRQTADLDPLQLAGKLAGYSVAYFRLEMWEQARPLLTECLEIRREKLPQAWSTFYAINMTGELKFRLGDEKSAEPLLLEGALGASCEVSSSLGGKRSSTSTPRRSQSTRFRFLQRDWPNRQSHRLVNQPSKIGLTLEDIV